MVGNSPSVGDAGLCYLLVCFRSHEFVSYLLASLYRSQDLFYIHCDAKAPEDLKGYIDALAETHDNVVVMPTHDYSWAGYSHVQVSLDAVRAALAHQRDWSHLIFLSEQHLPLKSPDAIERTLRERKSMAILNATPRMLPVSQADIRNRFGARYRELPGVGCFATELVERDATFFETIFHGTNWLAVHRDHCRYLIDAEGEGRFDLFKTIVHAEEMAMPTILAGIRDEVEQRDVTLVAAPHLVDNHGLVMTDALYESGKSSGFLFIRKRTPVLSEPVDTYIRSNHFRDDIYRLPSRARPAHRADAEPRARDQLVSRLSKLIERQGASVEAIDPRAHEFAAQLHLVVRTRALPPDRSVRVLSENLSDVKVCIVDRVAVDGTFGAPYVSDGRLVSTARVKLNELFGYRDILPLDIEGQGFCSLRDNASIEDLARLVERFLRAAEVGFKVAEREDRSIPQRPANMRADRINRLAKLSQAKRYLEIGVCFGETFFDVDIAEKVAVDPWFRFDFEAKQTPSTRFHQMTSDAYFETFADAPFDIIYLDGLHTYDQTTRDFLNSLQVAHDKTIWVIDDTVPNDAHAALPDQALCYHYRAMEKNPDPSWMGDVYKTVLFVDRVMPDYHFRTFGGHGQTVIWKGTRQRAPGATTPSLEAIGGAGYDYLVANMPALRVEEDERIFEDVRSGLFV